MKQNYGKKFESNIKGSFNRCDMFLYRLQDQQVKYGKGNASDFITYNKGKVVFLEAKTVNIPNLPFSNISNSQWRWIYRTQDYKDILDYYLIIKFRKENEVYIMNNNQILNFLNTNTRKSFPINYCRNNCTKVDFLENSKILLNIKKAFKEMED